MISNIVNILNNIIEAAALHGGNNAGSFYTHKEEFLKVLNQSLIELNLQDNFQVVENKNDHNEYHASLYRIERM